MKTHSSRHAIYILPTRKAIPSSKVLVFTSCCFPKPAVHTAGPGEGLLFGELLLSAILAAHRVVFSGCLAGGGLREECDMIQDKTGLLRSPAGLDPGLNHYRGNVIALGSLCPNSSSAPTPHC